MKLLQGYYRHDILNMLPDNSVGIELGVAEGIFSSRMLKSGKFQHVYAVDAYDTPHHQTDQYKRALLNVGIEEPYTLFRMTFEDALDLFPDDYFDFVYVDGFAHTGEEGGKTIYDWYTKVKPGGMLAGDDYHIQWPKVVLAVDRFCKDYGYELMVTDKTEKKDFCKYPTWCITKR